MALDGVTRFISDLIEFGNGFRDNNAWLATLTNHAFPNTFYIGDAFGSFNLWMRLLTGILLGFTMVWFLFPHLQATMNEISQRIEFKF